MYSALVVVKIFGTDNQLVIAYFEDDLLTKIGKQLVFNQKIGCYIQIITYYKKSSP